MVGSSLEAMVKKDFEHEEVEAFLNKTLLVLIPKVLKPESVSQFRPISLCTISYKLLMKVIVNCLKLVMSPLVAEN